MNENFNIVVADDEETIRDTFKMYLESTTNHTVLTAKDGLEALEIIKNKKIDCCFTDLSMPNMDGLALTKKIQAYDSTIPVVVMTGYPSMDNTIKTLKNGVVDFLTKPVKIDQLSPTIDRIMRERSLFINDILLKEEAEKNEKLVKIKQELQQKIKEVETINLILQKFDQATTSKDIFSILTNLSGEVTHCDEAHLCIFDQELKDHTIITSYFRDKYGTIESPKSIDKKIISKVADEGIPLLLTGANGNGSVMAVPLKIRTKVFSILTLFFRAGNGHFDEKDLYLLNFLTEKASFLVENMALYENIYENLFSILYAFVETIEAKDPYTKQHSTRVTDYAMSIAGAVGCSQEEIEVLTISANLHDIGKIGIPDRILLKPDSLTDEEYETIKKHPVIGSNIIGHVGMWTNEQKIIRQHHERWDGNGYPDKLKGKEISFLSRILSVADVFDALISDRSYRKKMSDDVALRIIQDGRGSQFDPEIVDVFLKLYRQGKLNT